jgi:hypothetical protein
MTFAVRWQAGLTEAQARERVQAHAAAAEVREREAAAQQWSGEEVREAEGGEGPWVADGAQEAWAEEQDKDEGPSVKAMIEVTPFPWRDMLRPWHARTALQGV